MFSILRGSKPIYHFIEFPCVIEKGQLFIKWGNKYAVQEPKEKEEKDPMFLKNGKKKWLQQQLDNPYCI